MPDLVAQLARVPTRSLFVYLTAVVYILFCLVLAAIAGRNFYAGLDDLSTVWQLLGLLLAYLLVLAVLDFLLAFVFALICHGQIFAVVRFLATGFFVVLPLTLFTFLAIIRIAKTPVLTPLISLIVSLALLLTVLLLMGAYFYARFVEPYRLRTTFYQMHSAKLAGLERPLRIVVLADIQTDRITAYEKRVFEKTLELKPDLILFAGDYLQCPDAKSYRRQASLLQQMLNDLNFTAPLGVFAVPGNAESRNGRDCFDGTKVQWLIDQTVTIQRSQVSICLIGLSLETGGTYVELPPNLLSNLDSANFNIVLSHQPDFVLDLPAAHAVDLCLAGHTHGGQICLPLIGPLTTACRIPRSQASGLHLINGTTLCISRGIGLERGWAPRLRFLCPPEIVVLDLLP